MFQFVQVAKLCILAMTMFGLCTLGSSLRFPEEMGNKGHAQCIAFVLTQPTKVKVGTFHVPST